MSSRNHTKLYEKIIANRLTYLLKYPNIYSEKQLEFRQNKSTQHAITLTEITINSMKKTHRTMILGQVETGKIILIKSLVKFFYIRELKY